MVRALCLAPVPYSPSSKPRTRFCRPYALRPKCHLCQRKPELQDTTAHPNHQPSTRCLNIYSLIDAWIGIITTEAAEALFNRIDTDKSGTIDYRETAACLSLPGVCVCMRVRACVCVRAHRRASVFAILHCRIRMHTPSVDFDGIPASPNYSTSSHCHGTLFGRLG